MITELSQKGISSGDVLILSPKIEKLMFEMEMLEWVIGEAEEMV